MYGDLAKHQGGNDIKNAYYDGTHAPVNVGLNVPPSMRENIPHIEWGGVVVDAIDERIEFMGWQDSTTNLGLDEVFQANMLDVESGLAHLDALTFGVGFVKVAEGDVGEANPLVTVEPTMGTTGVWDHRVRRLSSAFTLEPAEGLWEPEKATLYLPDKTIYLVREAGRWVQDDVIEHGYHRVPVVQVANRTSASMRLGHSEISLPVRDLVDEAARVILAMAVNREFLSAPQRLVLGASPGDIDSWKVMTGALWTIEADEDGNVPEVKVIAQASPGPHIEQLKALAAQLATASGVPDWYFGVSPTANPSSADAIRASEVRLIKKAERRAKMFGRAWMEVATLAMLVKTGSIPEELSQMSCLWGNPATPTAAAQADEASKLVGSGVLPARSRVTYRRVGLSPAEQIEVEEDWAKNPSTADVLSSMADRHTTPTE